MGPGPDEYGEQYAALYRTADHALMRAKQSGRGRVLAALPGDR